MSGLTYAFVSDASIAEELLIERRRQVAGEGFTLDQDDRYIDGQIAAAAGTYAAAAAHLQWPTEKRSAAATGLWPWPRPCKVGLPRRMLVKAGALIITEIERLDRKAAAKGGDA